MTLWYERFVMFDALMCLILTPDSTLVSQATYSLVFSVVEIEDNSLHMNRYWTMCLTLHFDNKLRAAYNAVQAREA